MALKAQKTKPKETIEMTRATMARMFVAPSGPDSTCMAGEVEMDGAGVIAEDCRKVGAGLLMSGWVCCILTVALGIAGLPGAEPSGGSVIRAVSFFGAAGFAGGGGGWTPLPTGGGGAFCTPLGAGAGLSGTVGRALPSAGGLGGRLAPLRGGFGGGVTPLTGLAGGSGMPGCEGGRGGGGASGLVAEGGGAGGVMGAGGGTGGVASEGLTIPGTSMRAVSLVAPGNSMRAVSFGAVGRGGMLASGMTIFVVSFFGVLPSGGRIGAGLPGRLIRTVSRFTCVG